VGHPGPLRAQVEVISLLDVPPESLTAQAEVMRDFDVPLGP